MSTHNDDKDKERIGTLRNRNREGEWDVRLKCSRGEESFEMPQHI
jgi:hypothetical protein